MKGVMKLEAFKQLQDNTVDIYLADCRDDIEEVERLQKWRLEFCNNLNNYAAVIDGKREVVGMQLLGE